MPPYMAFDLGLHCLPKYLFTSSQNEKGSKAKVHVSIKNKYMYTVYKKKKCGALIIFSCSESRLNTLNKMYCFQKLR